MLIQKIIHYLQCHGNLNKPFHHLILRQKVPFLLFQFMVQISSFTEAHDNIQEAIFPFPGFSVVDNIGMLQLRQQLSLLFCCFSLPVWRMFEIQFFDDILERLKKDKSSVALNQGHEVEELENSKTLPTSAQKLTKFQYFILILSSV